MFKSIFVIALTALMLPFQAHALGLGEMQVDSSLYQRFDARIDLLSTIPEDADTIIVQLASRAEFQKKGINRPMALSDLKFKVVAEDGELHIKITSKSIVHEPDMHFLLDVDWPEGRFLREYSVVLVPPKVL